MEPRTRRKHGNGSTASAVFVLHAFQKKTVVRRRLRRFLGFFEQVALLLRANLITDQLAYYMFGYYATRCDRSRWFWGSALPKDEAYWLLFLDFICRMKVVEDSKRADPSKFVAKIDVCLRTRALGA